MGIKRFHLIISGRVQGVSYRMSAWEKARQLGLSGWVRNLNDGRVEMIIEGDSSLLEQMTDWAGQGPRFASVTNVDVSEEKVSGDLEDFEIR
ncbi:MAG: acylphosphatase [Methylophaga sp.]|nr:acylphosphatase [Methylophaga sp.]